ncbi:FtsK/SpoIIIE domain-containing protein [Paenibacillus sp. H1-7]|uniref:FtsK/SpoIIIE domain-containing protein n=1 Tax=Paenibacillus sp. H1-7 TaxID=2282849 RepID=UPI001EF9212D|nr:FtsK/SpoIIIE domain-containing protein [Paenibacillus sp. H1-7]
MHNKAKQLLGEWMIELVAAYFIEQKKNNGDKLFIKVVGVDDDAWGEVLQTFADAEERLSASFLPVMRTLEPISGFEKYQCQSHETSTWLRNNTSHGSALLILLNATSAEAQSLENIFTIDEARLLSPSGLEVLYQILSDRYQYFGDDLDQLKRFLVTYGKIVEPQLRTVLAFLTAVIGSDEKTMTDRIQQHLDHLQLFRDRTLKFTGAGWKQLKENYQLSRLEKDDRSLGKERIVDNVYTFLEKHESHELWETVSKDDFRRHALDYVHGKSEMLLQYDFSMVKEAFMFTDKKPTVNERMNTFKESLELDKPLQQERDQLMTEAAESIQAGEKPEKLQEFLEEFGGELLVEDKKLYKDIERLIKKLRQLSEYTELTEALLRESFDLLKQQGDDSEISLEAVRFKLRIMEAPIGEEMKVVLQFHLGGLERLTGRISFDERTLDNVTDRTKDTHVGFRLVMLLDDEELGYRDFKLIDLHNSQLPDLLEKLAEEGYIPSIRSFAGTDTEQVDVISEMQDRVSTLVASGQPGVSEAATQFTLFGEWYIKQLEKARVQGIGIIDMTELEKRLEELLVSGRDSALIARHITQYIGTMGTIDMYSCKLSDKVRKIQSRVLTLLNPLRLLGYANRLLRIESELSKWIGRLNVTEDSLGDMDTLLNQLQDDLSRLSPAYFAVDGMPDHFLIEQQEMMGEGIFTINGVSSGEDQLVQTFADELLSTVKSYLEVYPYAKDCLDLVFLYCPQASFVTRAISQLFQHLKNVRKVKAIVHSNKAGAAIHEQLNAWISQEELLSERMGHFPRVEIQVIAEQDVNAMMKQVTQQLQDADIGILVNYFGQSSHLQYKLEKVQVTDSDNWFETIYREPLKKDDAVKRISCVSEQMPSVMQRFYQVQQVLNSSESVPADEYSLLRTIISVNQLSDQELLNYMHDHFNWSLFIDRYLDKPLLRYVSSKAQIIKYKSNAGQNKNFRTLLSSSKYIRKLASEQADHEYFDRLHQKYVKLLKNGNISKEVISQATEKVKEISGGVVLRAIGPGKFAHELIAIHLAIQARPVGNDELVVWSMCDDLPWFNGSARRPDLVRTSIRKNGERIALQFEIVELKFISHTIFDQERYDAIKQVNAGLEVYRNRFLFAERPGTAEMWRKELLYNLLEDGAYTLQDVQLLKVMQSVPLSSIDVSISGSIDTFVYTSNLLELSVMEGHDNGYQQELLGNAVVNNIYNRSYILRALGAMAETEVPDYDIGLQAVNAYITDKLGTETTDEVYRLNSSLDEKTNELIVVDGGNSPIDEEIAKEEIMNGIGQVASTALQHDTPVGTIDSIQQLEPVDSLEPPIKVTQVGLHSEQIAFAELASLEEQPGEDLTPVLRTYEGRLRNRMNEINVPLRIIETIVGVSVVRMVVELIGNTSFSLIKNRSEDLQMWLGLNAPPQIAIRGGRVNIDINRDTPEVVYFERFMDRMREQVPQAKLDGKLIAPLGVGQLGEVITMDFSSPDTPHLLIGGQSGSGKSVTINGIILAMMCLYSPKDVQFLFIDPKRVEFMVYKDRVHTQRVITDIEEAIDALDQVVLEMERRYDRFAQEGATNYNEYLELGGEHIPRIVVVFDEFADFMTQEKPLSTRVETAIKRLGAMARAAGIHLLLCTQSPRADIVPTNIRNNLGARLALRTADAHASRIVLDDEGAERLGGKGDFLAKLNAPEFVRGKSPFLTARAKKALLDHFRVDQSIEP